MFIKTSNLQYLSVGLIEIISLLTITFSLERRTRVDLPLVILGKIRIVFQLDLKVSKTVPSWVLICSSKILISSLLRNTKTILGLRKTIGVCASALIGLMMVIPISNVITSPSLIVDEGIISPSLKIFMVLGFPVTLIS